MRAHLVAIAIPVITFAPASKYATTPAFGASVASVKRYAHDAEFNLIAFDCIGCGNARQVANQDGVANGTSGRVAYVGSPAGIKAKQSSRRPFRGMGERRELAYCVEKLRFLEMGNLSQMPLR